MNRMIIGWFGWVLLSSVVCCADDGEALRGAARRGDVEAVQSLLGKGADINAASSYGVTALAIACDHGQIEVVHVLISAGAEINTKDRFYKFSPLSWAAMRQRRDIVKMLIDAGASDVDGVLSNAVGMQQSDVVEWILAGGKASEKTITDLVLATRNAKRKGAVSEKLDAILGMLEEKLSEDAKSRLQESEAMEAVKAKWADYLGIYKNDSNSWTIQVVDGELAATDPNTDRSIVLQSSEPDVFTSRGLTVQFVRTSGAISSLVWKTDEREQVYQRVAESSVPSPTTVDQAAVATGVVPLDDFPFDSDHWPQFRGPLARGISRGRTIATSWNGVEGTHVQWKTPIPGLGTSSPVVWGEHVFVTTAVQVSDEKGFRTGPYGDVESVEANGTCSYRLLCFDLKTGSLLWDREAANEVPKVKRHAKSSHANPTPATDGQHVIAFFGGAGIFCYDVQGNLLWKSDLGVLDSGWFYDRSYQWGFGSSPCIFEGMVIVQCDVQDGAFLAAIDIETGELKWRTPRDEIPTWSSPVGFMAQDGTPTVIVAGTKCSAAYHARSGERLWSLGGFSEIVVPTPQVLPTVFFLTSGYAPVQPMVLLRHGARGDLKIPDGSVDGSPFLWAQMRGGPYMPTPVILDGRIYILENNGILSGMELSTGKRLFRQRLRAANANAYTASPITDGSHVVCISEEGHAFVIAADGEGSIVSQNDLGEAVLATPAISQGKLLIRGEKHLFCIESSTDPK